MRERRVHLARWWGPETPSGPQGWFNACAAVAPFSWHDATVERDDVTCKLCRNTLHFRVDATGPAGPSDSTLGANGPSGPFDHIKEAFVERQGYEARVDRGNLTVRPVVGRGLDTERDAVSQLRDSLLADYHSVRNDLDACRSWLDEHPEPPAVGQTWRHREGHAGPIVATVDDHAGTTWWMIEPTDTTDEQPTIIAVRDDVLRAFWTQQ